MIGYFDTSAFVPLIIDEPSSAACRRLWEDADDVATTRLMYVEAVAAIARAYRSGRLTKRHHRASGALLDQFWSEFQVVEVDRVVVTQAAEIARRCGLRGYDAVHCASAAQLEDSDLVVASGDKNLLAVCSTMGMSTANINL